MDYPKLIFVGSDLGDDLFGMVPYLLVGLLALKIAARWLPSSVRSSGSADFARWDRLDVLLLTVYVVFLVLLDLVPNGFALDQYYSAPRIFRYLVPLSFAMTLHAAKMLLDLTAALVPRRRWHPRGDLPPARDRESRADPAGDRARARVPPHLPRHA